ncbi:MAG: YicC family protein [Lentimicrobiaceae bacterium]|nr:YicC family protein [Lentimicrobiaceae bacterium]
MIKSMTGFGKATLNCEGKTIVIEIRSLNSKQLDLSARISPLFRDKENEIRSLATKMLERGKIELCIYVEKTDNPTVSIDENLAKAYFEKLTALSKQINNPKDTDIFAQMLRIPDVISTPKEEISENLWNIVFEGVKTACESVNRFREEEGDTLSKDFTYRIQLISKMIDDIKPFENNRITELKKKLIENLENMPVKYDLNRLEQELIFYLEKLDITEEKVRLRKHCAYFMDTMKENNAGKKLGFIIQEIGREINTIGSKANDFNIQQIVVLMKDEAEKMKEQLANIL